MNKSTIKTLSIIEELSESEKGLTISEIAEKLSIPRSTVNDIIKALEIKGYIEIKNMNSKKYELTNKVLEISLKANKEREILEVVTPYLKKLVAEFNETAFFAIKSDYKILYLSKIESNSLIRTTAILGSRREMYYTGLGKAILSRYGDEELKDYLEKVDLLPMTKYTITNREKFIEDILLSKERGYSIDFRESEEEIVCIAAPIFLKGQVFGALSISGLFKKNSKKDLENKGKILKKITKEISQKLI